MSIDFRDHPVKATRIEGITQLATGCVHRLMELGLPEEQAFTAREAIIARMENYHDRLMAGEWEAH